MRSPELTSMFILSSRKQLGSWELGCGSTPNLVTPFNHVLALYLITKLATSNIDFIFAKS